MSKEKVHTVTDLAAPTNRKRALVWGGTALAGVAALLLVANNRAKRPSVDEDTSA